MKNTTIPKRRFVSEDLVIDSWKKIEPFFENLLNREISSVKDLERWMLDRFELEAILDETFERRYIKLQIDATNKEVAENFDFWVKNITPKIEPYFNKLNIKFIKNPFLEKLNQDEYRIYIRDLKNEIKLFRKNNTPLLTEMQSKKMEYFNMKSEMSVDWKGQEITIEKAASFLENTNRNTRELVYNKIWERRLQDKIAIDDLFDNLIVLRQQIAKNAGFDNYRDYKFAEMGRVDYTPQDCANFHDAIAKEIVPIITSSEKRRKEKLGYETYKAWDICVDVDGMDPLKPFDGGKELIDKSIKCLEQLNPYFGECISTMKAMKHLDLESKKGKAPGGFCAPLHETGSSFIFMNAVGSQADLKIMIHEAGHAIHGFLMKDLKIKFKLTSELAELASMTMELLSMDYWNVFYKDKNDIKRAKEEQLQRVLYALPIYAAVDKFQHWIYTTQHSAKERKEKWLEIESEFGNQIINYDNQEDVLANHWQNINHIFETPFYFIEYAIAQLGAIAIWKSYKETGEKALENYIDALKLGYTKSIPEIYETAGIKFDFSASYVKELADFIKEELEKLN